MIHALNKGKNGEREVANTLNGILILTMREMGRSENDILRYSRVIQRNQNQSAVGGNDLVNVFGLSIEVKRQELLSVESWWTQTLAGAARNNEWPVLLYRQNNKKWRCMTYGYLHDGHPQHAPDKRRVEINWIDFLEWFKSWIIVKLESGYEPRT
jgi:hypothetical protein